MELHELPKYNGIPVSQLIYIEPFLQSSLDNIQAKKSSCNSNTVIVYMYIFSAYHKLFMSGDCKCLVSCIRSVCLSLLSQCNL